MKKIHIALLVAAFLTAITSVYSLAAINQVYDINFQWYSTFTKAYSDEIRDLSRDKWQMEGEDPKIVAGVTSSGYVDTGISERINKEALDLDYEKYFIIWATMGEVTSPEYSIRFSNIAQRGDVVEVILSFNSPEKIWDRDVELTKSYYPYDVIRVKKNSLSGRGKLLFIFKDQNGRQLYSEYMYI